MATYTIQDTTLTNIADAIRTKGNTTETLTPVEMPDAINAIQAGGEEKTVRPTDYLASGSTTSMRWVSNYSDTAPKIAGAIYANLSTSTSQSQEYLWYKKTKNDVWPIAFVRSNDGIEDGETYRITFWIWCSKGKTVEWSSNNVYFNANCRTTHNLGPITENAQLFDWTFTYTKSSSSYEPTLHIYPAFTNTDADTGLFITPVRLMRVGASASYYGTYPSVY